MTPVEIKNFKKNYIFLFEEEKDEKTFFCTCGKKVNKNNNKADDSEVKIDINSNHSYFIDHIHLKEYFTTLKEHRKNIIDDKSYL
jgi:hypothetical protein